MEESQKTHNYSPEQKRRITEFLAEYITDHKKQLIEKVLGKRTRHVALVLEDIYKTHNASAVLRTAECLGVQDIHIIQNTNEYTINPYVLRGSLKWLTLNTYGDGQGMYTGDCFDDLRKKGYKILVTSVHQEAKQIEEIDAEQKWAVVFGTEHSGISDYARDHADEIVTIPMSGFTESFNVSVSAGIILQRILFNLRSSHVNWNLSAMEKEELRFEWYKQIPPHADQIIQNFVNSEGI